MSFEKKHALVVEEERAWQEILSEILQDMGLVVDVAENLEQAVEVLRSHPIRFMVVDLALAGNDYHNQDGLLVLRAAQQYSPDCVSVLLTGFATVELAVSAIQDYGAFTCLRKETFRRAAFKEWVNQALQSAPQSPARTAGGGGSMVITGLSHAPEATERAALLVEDDAGWRSLLSELLGENGYEVETSASYGQARGSLQSRRFDLAVVDLSLASSLAPESNRDGYRLLSSFQARGVTTIVVSGTAEVELIEQAYATYGVFTCLEKQGFERAAFVETLQRAQAAGRVHPDLERLTARELEVLALLAQGLTNKEIAKDLTISINTVKRHLKSIFEKLDVNTRSAASAKAIAAGFKPADGAIEG